MTVSGFDRMAFLDEVVGMYSSLPDQIRNREYGDFETFAYDMATLLKLKVSKDAVEWEKSFLRFANPWVIIAGKPNLDGTDTDRVEDFRDWFGDLYQEFLALAGDIRGEFLEWMQDGAVPPEVPASIAPTKRAKRLASPPVEPTTDKNSAIAS
jgi:hypothetical protein